jgi:hypothetical protein
MRYSLVLLLIAGSARSAKVTGDRRCEPTGAALRKGSEPACGTVANTVSGGGRQ